MSDMRTETEHYQSALRENAWCGFGAAMAKAIIHIGMDKAGSTSIQESLIGYDNQVAYYPTIDGQPNHSDHVMALFRCDETRQRINAERAGIGKRPRNIDVAFHEAELTTAINRAGNRILIYSSEGIYLFGDEDIRNMRRRLEALFDDYRLVAYVRPPRAYISSSFQLGVKSRRLSEFDVAGHYRGYRRPFERFDTIFGRERVLLLPFVPLLFHKRDAVANFCYHLDLPVPIETKLSNPSQSLPVIGAIYLLNRAFEASVDPKKHKSTVSAVIKHSGREGPTFRFSSAILDPIVSCNSDDIAWISHRIGYDMSTGHPDAKEAVRAEEDLLRAGADYLRRLARDDNFIPEALRGHWMRLLVALG